MEITLNTCASLRIAQINMMSECQYKAANVKTDYFALTDALIPLIAPSLAAVAT